MTMSWRGACIASATTRSVKKIDHVDGVTVEEAEHQIATRLLSKHRARPFQPVRRKQRTIRSASYLWRERHFACARVVFQWPGQCLSCCGDNGGRHVAPLFAGCGISHGRKCSRLPSCQDARTSAPFSCAPLRPRIVRALIFQLTASNDYDPAVILDLDYWVLMPC